MKCLICYKALNIDETDYHSKCITKIFGLKTMPEINVDANNLKDYAKKIIGANNAITGVQPKLSLYLEQTKTNIRFTIVDNKSNYIIKPQSASYLFLPEIEDLCMHMAAEVGIKVAEHCLVKLKNGKTAYLTKRFDREKSNKIACEDLCQLSETLTEHKYRGSYEKVGKTIHQYSTQPGFDLLQYFNLVLFSFITGNADMHLKNFSMIELEDNLFCLSPAYDLVSTYLVLKAETEQMALFINGKQNKISRKDFDTLGHNLKITDRQIQNSYNVLMNKLERFNWWIDHSFLSLEQKNEFKKLISSRIEIFR